MYSIASRRSGGSRVSKMISPSCLRACMLAITSSLPCSALLCVETDRSLELELELVFVFLFHLFCCLSARSPSDLPQSPHSIFVLILVLASAVSFAGKSGFYGVTFIMVPGLFVILLAWSVSLGRGTSPWPVFVMTLVLFPLGVACFGPTRALVDWLAWGQQRSAAIAATDGASFNPSDLNDIIPSLADAIYFTAANALGGYFFLCIPLYVALSSARDALIDEYNSKISEYFLAALKIVNAEDKQRWRHRTTRLMAPLPPPLSLHFTPNVFTQASSRSRWAKRSPRNCLPLSSSSPATPSTRAARREWT